MLATLNGLPPDSRGVLKVAEVASRFEDVRGFLTTLSNLGFKMTSKVRLNKATETRHHH